MYCAARSAAGTARVSPLRRFQLTLHATFPVRYTLSVYIHYGSHRRRGRVLHRAELLSDEELFAIEDVVADVIIELESSTVGGAMTLQVSEPFCY